MKIDNTKSLYTSTIQISRRKLNNIDNIHVNLLYDRLLVRRL